MIETRTTKQISDEYDVLWNMEFDEPDNKEIICKTRECGNKVWVGLESLKELLKEMWEKDLIEVYAYEVLQEELGLCNSQEQKVQNTKKCTCIMPKPLLEKWRKFCGCCGGEL